MYHRLYLLKYLSKFPLIPVLLLCTDSPSCDSSINISDFKHDLSNHILHLFEYLSLSLPLHLNLFIFPQIFNSKQCTILLISLHYLFISRLHLFDLILEPENLLLWELMLIIQICETFLIFHSFPFIFDVRLFSRSGSISKSSFFS